MPIQRFYLFKFSLGVVSVISMQVCNSLYRSEVPTSPQNPNVDSSAAPAPLVSGTISQRPARQGAHLHRDLRLLGVTSRRRHRDGVPSAGSQFS